MRDPRYPLPHDVSLVPLSRALIRAEREMARLIGELAAAHGLTTSQFDVLATLGDTEGLTFKALSTQALVTAGTLTPVLDRLVKKGLVVRCEHPSDKRQIIVKLTAEGQALYEASFLPTVDAVRVRLATLDPGDEAELIRLLTRVADILA